MRQDQHHLYVRTSQLFHLRNHPPNSFTIGEPAVAIVRVATPGAEMHFVDGDGLLEPIGVGALRSPSGVIPFVAVQVGENGAGSGAKFGAKRVGIRFERQHVSVGADDFVFVDAAFVELRNKKFPNAGGSACSHGIDAAGPVIEIAYDADAPGAGRPDGKINATHAFYGVDVGAELVVRVVVSAL